MKTSTFFILDEDPLTFSSTYCEWTIERLRFSKISAIFDILFPQQCFKTIYLNSEYTSEGIDFIRMFIEFGKIGQFTRNNIFDFLWFCSSWRIESAIEIVMEHVKTHFNMTDLVEFLNKMFMKGIDTSFLINFLKEEENQEKLKSASFLKKLPISIVEKLLFSFSSTLHQNEQDIFSSSLDQPENSPKSLAQKKRRFTLMRQNPVTNLIKPNLRASILANTNKIIPKQEQNKNIESQNDLMFNNCERYLSSSQVLNLVIYFLQRNIECLSLLNFVDFSTVSRPILKRFLEALQKFSEEGNKQTLSSSFDHQDLNKNITDNKCNNSGNSLINKICQISYKTITSLEKENSDLRSKNEKLSNELAKQITVYVNTANKIKKKSQLVSFIKEIENNSSGNSDELQRSMIDYFIYKEIKDLNKNYSKEFLLNSAKSYFPKAVLKMAIKSEKKSLKESMTYYSTFLGNKFKSNEDTDQNFCRHLLEITKKYEGNNDEIKHHLLPIINKIDVKEFPEKRKSILFTIFEIEGRIPDLFIIGKAEILEFYQGKSNTIFKTSRNKTEASFEEANIRIIKSFPVLNRCMTLEYCEAHYFYINKLMSVCNNAESSNSKNKESDFKNCFEYVFSRIDQDDKVFEFYYGTLKFFGEGFCEKDDATAMTVLEKSARSNYPMAMLFYGVLLNLGTKGKPSNITSSKKYLTNFIKEKSFDLRKDEFEKKVALFIYQNINILEFGENLNQISGDELNYYYEIKAILIFNFKETLAQNGMIVHQSKSPHANLSRKRDMNQQKTHTSIDFSKYNNMVNKDDSELLKKKDSNQNYQYMRSDSNDTGNQKRLLPAKNSEPNESKMYDYSEKPKIISIIRKQQYINSKVIVDLIIGNDIEIIKEEAFFNCENLKFVFIPSSVKKIGRLAFANCTLLEFFVCESSSTEIDPSAFLYCDNVQIKYYIEDKPNTNPETSSPKNKASYKRILKYSKPIFIHDYIQNNVFQGEYVVPFGQKMLSFDDYDFRPMKTMIIPWSVKCIEKGAFKNNNTIENVIILGNCYIKKKAFKHCQSLKSVKFISSRFSAGSEKKEIIKAVKSISDQENSDDNSNKNNLSHPLHHCRQKSYSANKRTHRKSKDQKNSNDLDAKESNDINLRSDIKPSDYITGNKSIFHSRKILANSTDNNDSNDDLNYNSRCFSTSFDNNDENFSIIGRQSFEECFNLESLYIPNKINRIEDFAFINCTKLKKVRMNKSMLTINRNDSESKDCFCASSIFFCCPADLMINKDSFSKHILSEYDSDKFTVDFDRNISSIKVDQFKNDPTLENVLIMWNISRIHDNAFNYCSKLKSVIIFTENLVIHDKAFINCINLSEVSIVVRGKCDIGMQAFGNCKNLNEFNLVSQFSKFSSKVFDSCAELETFNIPNGLKTLPKELFIKCTKLKYVTLPKSMETIEDRCFMNCLSLETINIPKNVQVLGNECFMSCKSLKTIIISNSLKTIGNKCFFGCEKLEKVSLFSSYSSNKINKNDCNAKNNYNVDFKLEKLSESCFERCVELKEISLPSSIKSLGDRCFMSCTELEKVDLSYTKIAVLPVYSFSHCSKLKTILLPHGEHLKKILLKSFEECYEIEEITFPLSITEIGEKVFMNCKKLKCLDLEKNQNIFSIEADTFNGCSSLNNFIFPKNVKTIKSGAFSNCEKLNDIELPNQIEGIFEFAFSDCLNLRSVIIQSRINRFDQTAFENCPNFKQIIIRDKKCGANFEKEDWVKNRQIQIINE